MKINDILRIFRKWLLLIILLPVVCVLIAGFYFYQVATPQYTSYAEILVFHQANENSITGSDLGTSEEIINDFIKIVYTSPVMQSAATRMGVTLDTLEACKISITKETDTRVVKISITSSDPTFSYKAVKAMTTVAIESAQEYLQTDNIREIEPACEAYQSGPASLKNTLMAGVIGVVAAVAIALVVELLNTTVRTAEDVEKQLGLAVLAKIPRFDK